MKTLILLFTANLYVCFSFSQSVSFNDLVSIAQKKTDDQYWFFMGKQFSRINPKITGSDTIVNLTKNFSTQDEETVYINGIFTKKDGSKHSILDYYSLNMNYVLDILKQMPKTIKLTSSNSKGSESVYNYETNDLYIQITVNTKAGEYSGFLLVCKADKE